MSKKQLQQICLRGGSWLDATKVAKERALAMKPHDLEHELETQDARYRAVALRAIERVNSPRRTEPPPRREREMPTRLCWELEFLVDTSGSRTGQGSNARDVTAGPACM